MTITSKTEVLRDNNPLDISPTSKTAAKKTEEKKKMSRV